MLPLLSLILFIAVTSFIGFNIILLFGRQGIFTLLERIGLSYLFGIAAISLEIFILGIFKTKFATSYVLLPWLPLVILNIVRYRTSIIKPQIRKRTFPRFDLFEKLLFSLLSFEVIYTFFRALMKPIEAYDSVAIWSLKAKILYFAKTVPADFFHMIGATFNGIHPDYPLLVPFSEVWFYTFFNNFNDYLVKAIFPLSFLAFLLVFYSVLERLTKNRKISLLFTFILASVKQFSDYATIGVSDLQLGVYCFLTFVFLFMWAKYKSTPYLAGSVISCAFAFWTKNEGGIVLLIMLALLTGLLFKKYNFRYVALAIFILLALFIAWFAFKADHGLQSDIVNIDSFKKLDPSVICKRVIPIAYEYQKHIFGFKKWNLVWIVFLYVVIVRFKKLFREEYRYITIPVFGILLAYTAVYLITPRDIAWHLGTSASRLLLHVLPLSVFLIALNINDIYNERR